MIRPKKSRLVLKLSHPKPIVPPPTYLSRLYILLISLEAVVMQRVEILSTTTKSKKIEVKGGFYNEEDMKSELGYHQ